MKLLERLSAGEWENIVIQCHNSPDADTIASGFALYSYLKEQGKSPRLVYSGWDKISKPNLKRMIDVCGISALEYVPMENEEEADLLITVDCQSGEGNVAPLRGKTVAVIDHHSVPVPRKKMPVEMALSRFRSYDSCAAILWEMLKEAGFPLDKKLATALYYGLYMDTNYFKRLRHPMDQRMMSDLGTAKIDHEIFNQLKACTFTQKEIRTLGAALAKTSFNFDFRFAVVEAPDCDPNLLGAISDQMMETEDVNVCLAYCLKGNGVKLSARSYDPKILTHRLVNQIALGLGSGGGTEDKAGGFLENIQNACPDASPGAELSTAAGRLLSGRLAVCLAQGKASEDEPWRSPKEGEDIQKLTQRAEDGDVVAQYHLGICYEKSEGVDRNWEKAFQWYQRAAERDMWEALDKEETARQGEKDPVKNQEWETRREQALKAWAAAQRAVGRCFAQKRGVVCSSPEEAVRKAAEWYQKAADNGDDHGQLNLARYCAQGKAAHVPAELSADLAAEWLHKAAGQGYSWAQKELADCYAGGEPGFQKDEALAAYWYELAAKKGSSEAMKALTG